MSVADQRVVVSKDADFYHSHLLHGRPWKLVLVRTGNLGVRATKEMFARHLPAITAALEECSLVELDQQRISIVV